MGRKDLSCKISAGEREGLTGWVPSRTELQPPGLTVVSPWVIGGTRKERREKMGGRKRSRKGPERQAGKERNSLFGEKRKGLTEEEVWGEGQGSLPPPPFSPPGPKPGLA